MGRVLDPLELVIDQADRYAAPALSPDGPSAVAERIEGEAEPRGEVVSSGAEVPLEAAGVIAVERKNTPATSAASK